MFFENWKLKFSVLQLSGIFFLIVSTCYNYHITISVHINYYYNIFIIDGLYLIGNLKYQLKKFWSDHLLFANHTKFMILIHRCRLYHTSVRSTIVVRPRLKSVTTYWSIGVTPQYMSLFCSVCIFVSSKILKIVFRSCLKDIRLKFNFQRFFCHF